MLCGQDSKKQPCCPELGWMDDAEKKMVSCRHQDPDLQLFNSICRAGLACGPK